MEKMCEDGFQSQSYGVDSTDRAITVANFFCVDQTSQMQLELSLDIIDRSEMKITCLRGLNILYFVLYHSTSCVNVVCPFRMYIIREITSAVFTYYCNLDIYRLLVISAGETPRYMRGVGNPHHGSIIIMIHVEYIHTSHL